MEGRRIGEPGNYKATAYIASEFKRLGLKPAGENGTYFQVLDYGISGFDTSSARLAIAGTALAIGNDWAPTVPSATNGVAASVDLQNVPTVFAGRAGDTTVTLDPAIFRGKVAVFVATSAGGGNNFGGGNGRGGGRGAANASFATCSADQGWPNQRGAAYALALAAAQIAARGGTAQPAGRGGRGGRGRRRECARGNGWCRCDVDGSRRSPEFSSSAARDVPGHTAWQRGRRNHFAGNSREALRQANRPAHDRHHRTAGERQLDVPVAGCHPRRLAT